MFELFGFEHARRSTGACEGRALARRPYATDRLFGQDQLARAGDAQDVQLVSQMDAGKIAAFGQRLRVVEGQGGGSGVLCGKRHHGPPGVGG